MSNPAANAASDARTESQTGASGADEQLSPRAYVDGLSRAALDHRALHHPFFDRLLAGAYPDPAATLRYFTHQYRAYSVHFTTYLTTVISRLSVDRHKSLLLENLSEEKGLVEIHNGHALPKEAMRPHSEMFGDFMTAVGVDKTYQSVTPVLPVAQEWAQAFQALCGHPRAEVGVGAIGLGTEHIVPTFYGKILNVIDKFDVVSKEDRLFFELHAEMDEDHAENLLQISIDLVKADDDARGFLREGMTRALALRSAFLDAVDETLLGRDASCHETRLAAGAL